MSEIYIIAGTTLLSFGTATGAYLAYKLFDVQKYNRSNSGSLIVLLSETLIATIIGVLQIYCYSCDCTETFPDINDILNQTSRQEESDEICESKIECMYQKMLMEQLVLTISAVHSFVSLITSSALCKKFKTNCSSTEDQSTSINLEKFRQITCSPNFQTTILSIVAQWLLPIVSASLLCYVMNMSNETNVCEATNPVPKVTQNFQTLVSHLLEHPMNVTEKSVYDSEIENIVGKVYSIVESATQPSDIKKVTNLDDGFEILNIIERLNTQNYRTPKEIKYDFSYNNTSFKIYTGFLLLLGIILPISYSNNAHTKLQMMLKMSGEMTKEMSNQINLQDKIKYLKISIITAAALWAPSTIEIFSRTFITETQPNITMHILMAIGSSYMLVRHGINLKLLKSFIGQQNSVVPSV